MAIEWWVVLATFVGPIVAVQTQKWIEWATERRASRRRIFTALMANRASRLNDDYIRALNLIDLEFSPKRLFGKADRPVIDAWRALFGELVQGVVQGETDEIKIQAWNQRVDEKVVELLAAMSVALGYDFSKEELRRGIYYPKGRVDLEQAQLALVHGFRGIVEGKLALPIKITSVPGSIETAELQATLNKTMLSAYDKDGSLKVKVSQS